MAGETVRFSPLGDSMMLLTFGDEPSQTTNDRVRAAALHLEAERPTGVTEVVPAIVSLALVYDPLTVGFGELVELARSALEELPDEPTPPRGRAVEIPVLYGGDAGPDLADVAEHAGLGPDEVVTLHSEPAYRVTMIGFTPGFPYLSGLPPSLATPRRDSPRARVPAGSVGIAGAQTGIYPQAAPGGWQLIGRTPTVLFDAHIDPPARLAPGDELRFVPITPDRYEELAGDGT